MTRKSKRNWRNNIKFKVQFSELGVIIQDRSVLPEGDAVMWKPGWRHSYSYASNLSMQI